MAYDDRRAYSVAASQEVQGEFDRVASQLESLIADRDRAVKSALTDYSADGVSEEYQAKEARWTRAADEVRSIITVLRRTMESNDGTAAQTGARARAAVENIG
ncbi:pore-forming ESAT-6 family protein [Microbacterium sp. 179-I 3D4 NHS]|uniref:pore-forming ESAT-6 family protein n=1 Tax=Microbacterium sp. 179-I 3D4 NHS TaxID=3142381 RepID=UPI0039A39346